MFDFHKDKKNRSLNYSFDRNKTMLILGQAETEYKSGEIFYFESLNEVEKFYGKDSDLTEAYKTAKSIGAPYIFLGNCYKFTDYIDILDLILQNEFAYIAPVSINFSDTFINPGTNREMYISEFYSNAIADKLSLILMTDKHASLYEDIEHYLSELTAINMKFKERTFNGLVYGENLCFIANLLQNYKFSNVALASVLTISNLKDYPKYNLGDVVFDISNYDLIGQEIVYFEYNNISKTSIENFQNYHSNNSPEKFIPVSLVKKIIQRSLNFEQFTGKLLNAYTKLMIENYINNTISTFLIDLIQDYKILKIEYLYSEDHRVIIQIDMKITPYNSIESIDMYMEV